MNNRNKVNDDDSDGDEKKRYIKAYIYIHRERGLLTIIKRQH